MSRKRTSTAVLIVGAGKVGHAFASALRTAGVRVFLRSSRAGLPTRALEVDALLVATRESDFPLVVEHFATRRLIPASAVALHVAGSLSSAALAGLRASTAGVGQLHPLLAFAGAPGKPTLRGGHALVEGDPAAVRVARELARRVGLIPRLFPGLDVVGYHAAAGLVANGAAALVAAGTEVLAAAGVPMGKIPALLGPLLRSVAENVEALGMPAALTGPVRRGDVVAVGRHRETLARLAPTLGPLYDALLLAQLPAARALGDASDESLGHLAAALTSALPPLHRG